MAFAALSRGLRPGRFLRSPSSARFARTQISSSPHEDESAIRTSDQVQSQLISSQILVRVITSSQTPKCPEAHERWSKKLRKIAPNEQDDKGYLRLRAVGVNALPCLDRCRSDWRGPLTQRRDLWLLFNEILWRLAVALATEIIVKYLSAAPDKFHTDSDMMCAVLLDLAVRRFGSCTSCLTSAALICPRSSRQEPRSPGIPSRSSVTLKVAEIVPSCPRCGAQCPRS